jgi:hypothetical protein
VGVLLFIIIIYFISHSIDVGFHLRQEIMQWRNDLAYARVKVE